MLGAIFIGLSGMDAYSRGLQLIGNNVANLNSLGYKSASVNFFDMYSYLGGGYSQFGGANSESGGSGVGFGQQRVDFRQGELRQSDGDLDLGIQGDGFLVLMDGAKTVYGRTGQFTVDEDGFVTLQGTDFHLATLDASGQPVELNIASHRTNPPGVTTKISFSGILSTTATTDTIVKTDVFDSTGAKHTWEMKFTEGDAVTAPGEWTVTITDETGATVGTTTLKFNGGVVDPATSTLTIDTTPSGASAMSVVLDFSEGVSSFSSGTSSTLTSTADGHAVGHITAAKVNSDGQVELDYSNGEKELLGSVAVAEFIDPQLLQRAGSGLFENTKDAQVQLLASGADGAGKVLSNVIEASNVDLTAQFGDLILVQRGFQASSQVVSVSNDMIQQLFGIRGQG